jgi:YidC/Oxa1 family membrane protein insertase
MMSGPTMDRTQRQIMLLLPLFFVLFIISFPAGVIVYWITTNAWTILQQYIVKKRIGPIGVPAVQAASAEGSGAGAGSASDGGGANGASGGGLGGLLRGRLKPEEPAPVAATSRGRGGPPPPPPRKKKKRSGRRR